MSEKTNGNGHALATLEPRSHLPAEVMEKVVVGGDLSKLTASERLAWYQFRCESAGLDPAAQPFQYMFLHDKLTLYATKAATDQLTANRDLTVEILDRRLTGDLYEVQCRVTLPDGRHVDDLGAVSIQGLRGDALANAIMKCVTKSKRRTVLSACGLGMLDETEVVDVPRVAPPESSRKALDAPTAPTARQREDAFEAWSKDVISQANAKWLDLNTDATGEVAEGFADLVTAHQFYAHFYEKLRTRNPKLPEQPKAREVLRALADSFARYRERFEAEAETFLAELWDARVAERSEFVEDPFEADGDGEFEPLPSFPDWIDQRALAANVGWRRHVTGNEDGCPMPANVKTEIVNPHQLIGHLFKFGLAKGLCDGPLDSRPKARAEALGRAWGAQRDTLSLEGERYLVELFEEAAARLPKEPGSEG